MNLTDPRGPKTPLWLTALKFLAFIVPLAALCAFLWQQNEAHKGLKIYPTAFEYELAYAEKDVLNSQVYVARAYDTGFQVEMDKAKAVEWYRKAAFQGHRAAQYEYGRHLLEGEGIEANEAEGFTWIQKGAFKAWPPAQYHVAQLWCEGRGTPKDCPRGIAFMAKAADQGYAAALIVMAPRYEAGQDIEADLTKAYVHYALIEAAFPSSDEGKAAKDALKRLETQMTPAQVEAAKTTFKTRWADQSKIIRGL